MAYFSLFLLPFYIIHSPPTNSYLNWTYSFFCKYSNRLLQSRHSFFYYFNFFRKQIEICNIMTPLRKELVLNFESFVDTQKYHHSIKQNPPSYSVKNFLWPPKLKRHIFIVMLILYFYYFCYTYVTFSSFLFLRIQYFICVYILNSTFYLKYSLSIPSKLRRV